MRFLVKATQQIVPFLGVNNAAEKKLFSLLITNYISTGNPNFYKMAEDWNGKKIKMNLILSKDHPATPSIKEYIKNGPSVKSSIFKKTDSQLEEYYKLWCKKNEENLYLKEATKKLEDLVTFVERQKGSAKRKAVVLQGQGLQLDGSANPNDRPSLDDLNELISLGNNTVHGSGLKPYFISIDPPREAVNPPQIPTYSGLSSSALISHEGTLINKNTFIMGTSKKKERTCQYCFENWYIDIHTYMYTQTHTHAYIYIYVYNVFNI